MSVIDKRSARARLSSLLRAWRRERRGSVITEFAIAAPLLIAALVGSFEMASMIAAKSRASDIAMTIGDLVAKNKVIDEERIADLFAAADATLEAGALKAGEGSEIEVVVTSALACPCDNDKSSFCFTSLWSEKYIDGDVKDGYDAEDELTQIPSTVAFNKNDTIVMTEVTYTYSPPLDLVLDGGDIEFEDRVYHSPRFTDRILHTGDQSEASALVCPDDDDDSSGGGNNGGGNNTGSNGNAQGTPANGNNSGGNHNHNH